MGFAARVRSNAHRQLYFMGEASMGQATVFFREKRSKKSASASMPPLTRKRLRKLSRCFWRVGVLRRVSLSSEDATKHFDLHNITAAIVYVVGVFRRAQGCIDPRPA